MSMLKNFFWLFITVLAAGPSGAQEITDLSFHEQTSAKTDSSLIFKSKGAEFYFHYVPYVDFSDIAEIKERRDARHPQLQLYEITLTEEGAQKNYEVSARNLGKRIAVAVNGEIVAAPTVFEPYKDKTLMVSF